MPSQGNQQALEAWSSMHWDIASYIATCQEKASAESKEQKQVLLSRPTGRVWRKLAGLMPWIIY